ncbi:MAG: Re/Si-specific NAD(P)(+) transhydrogenase subunit alpha [Gemmatimonadota bacterium]|nr:Re/Si-specific NAD(P)(+) transhydrogenase subunit alpha [Gemmatimonadota bacterium]
MNVAIPKETRPGERRVSFVPDMVKRMVKAGQSVRVEKGAGDEAGFSDEQYSAVGAEIVSDHNAIWSDADLVITIHMPAPDDIKRMKSGSTLVGFLFPAQATDAVKLLSDGKVTSFSMESLPRITRAQSMDVLSSMSTVSGYKAVLMAAATSGKFFPMLVTAAGTIAPSKVLILGAGVAGLQAIATARRLGAVVEAFDVRPAVKEQVESLGAKFLEIEAVEDAETAGGYAKELSEEENKKIRELTGEAAARADIVITTALIPGRPAPKLIEADVVRKMKPGAVIVDLAAEAGGNCELTQPGKDVVENGVIILGPANLPATMPTHASQMYAKNINTFLDHLLDDGKINLDLEDEIIGATCITHDGEVRHELTRKAMEGGSGS